MEDPSGDMNGTRVEITGEDLREAMRDLGT